MSGQRLLKCTQISNIDSQQWRPLLSPLAIYKQYFYDNLDPRPGPVKFEVSEKVCTDILKKKKKPPKMYLPLFFENISKNKRDLNTIPSLIHYKYNDVFTGI